MKYNRFKNIEIDNYLGVSPVGEDTLLMAQKAAKLIYPSYAGLPPIKSGSKQLISNPVKHSLSSCTRPDLIGINSA